MNTFLSSRSREAVRLFRKLYPVTSHYDQGRFFTLDNGHRAATPLFLVLLIIETTDVAFALDSIPAALAITSNAFIVFTSNIFAILGMLEKDHPEDKRTTMKTPSILCKALAQPLHSRIRK